jgi:predicted RNA-binding protein with PUA-like domain
MKQFVTLLIFILCSSIQMNAQTYLDHLKQKNPGQGVVTVHQSKAIDELVNGKQVPTHTNQVNPQDEAWRSMRVSSYTDFILTKIQRVKEIEDIAGATLVSEGIDANYMDIINYAVFGAIKMGEK